MTVSAAYVATPADGAICWALRRTRAILNHMVHYHQSLDGVFAALSDPTRRAILERLGRASATISELAEPSGISLTGCKKHVGVLEEAELVDTTKVGRARHCSLGPRRLDDARLWIESYGRTLDARLERLDQFLQDTKGEQQ